MGGIFISYRRMDAEGEANHLLENLKRRFGAGKVFMDVADIGAGVDFREELQRVVHDCDVLLTVIGAHWLSCTDESGARRLNDPKDLVRFEVASALTGGKRVIPVLVQEASIPRADELPEDLKELAWRNAFGLRHTRWESDVAALVGELKRSLPPPKWRTVAVGKYLLATATLAVAAILVGIAVRPDARRGLFTTPSAPPRYSFRMSDVDDEARLTITNRKRSKSYRTKWGYSGVAPTWFPYPGYHDRVNSKPGDSDDKDITLDLEPGPNTLRFELLDAGLAPGGASLSIAVMKNGQRVWAESCQLEHYTTSRPPSTVCTKTYRIDYP